MGFSGYKNSTYQLVLASGAHLVGAHLNIQRDPKDQKIYRQDIYDKLMEDIIRLMVQNSGAPVEVYLFQKTSKN